MDEQNNNQNNTVEFEDHPEVIALQNQLLGMSKEVMKKTIDQLRSDISQLSSKIDQLKKKREEHNAQARHYKNMRNNVSDDKFAEVNQYRDEANSEKELRDKCNEQIRINKERREEYKIKLREAWDKVKVLREKYYQMKDEVGVLPEDLTQEIRDLEWKQQTSSLDSDEDAAITKRIAELYEKAYTAHIIGFSSEELEEAIIQAKKYSEEHEQAHQNVLHFHEEGQKHHQRMQELYKLIDGKRGVGNDLHDKYVEERQAADLAHQNIVDSYERIKLSQYLMDLIDDEQIRRRQEKAMEKREIEKEKTQNKQKSSKRLTLDELRLLMDEDEEEDN